MSGRDPKLRTQVGAAAAAAWLPFCCSRTIVFVLLICCQCLRTETIPAREGVNTNLTIEIHRGPVLEGLHRVLGSADAAWYRDIAEHGYDQQPFSQTAAHNWVFFPFLPLLMRVLSASGADIVLATAGLANICFFLALAAMYQLAKREGLSEAAAQRAIWLAAFMPTSYFFSAPLTESFFLLFVVSSWLAWRSGYAVAAGLAFTLAALSRPTGLLLLPAYSLELWSRRSERGPGWWFAATAPVLAAGCFLCLLWQLTGNPFAFSANQPAWGRPGGGIEDLAWRMLNYRNIAALPWNITWLNSASLLLTFCGAAIYARQHHWQYSLFLLIPALALLNSGTVLSAARISMVLFPSYLLAAPLLERATAERALFAVLAAGLAVMTVLYGLLVTGGMA